MDKFSTLGRWIVIAGVVLVVVGGIIWLLGRVPGLSKLPGTLRIETSGLTCVFPILASIVISILLTVVLNIVLRLFNRP
jgi:hypothetical protein